MTKYFLVFFIVLILLSCSDAPLRREPIVDMQAGYQPEIDTDEAGIWHAVEKVEQDLRSSGQLITDEGLNHYVKNIVCDLAGNHCGDIRVYVVHVPYFNATMFPNGMMQVWSGLLLRVQNEAQLAYILGHEIAHYLKRHSLQSIRKARSTTDWLTAFSILTAAGGVGYVGSIAELAATGALLKFSRDHEREADLVGFELLQHRYYDPREAAIIWKNLIAEQDAMDEDKPSLFFSTHPPTTERIETLTQEAMQLSGQHAKWIIEKQAYHQVIIPHLKDFLADEIRLRQFEATQVLLDRLMQDQLPQGLLWFAQGELYRIRNDQEQEDMQSAKKAYLQATAYEDVPNDLYRSLGIVCQKLAQNLEAKKWFSQYLDKEPDAFDKAMINAQIQRL